MAKLHIYFLEGFHHSYSIYRANFILKHPLVCGSIKNLSTHILVLMSGHSQHIVLRSLSALSQCVLSAWPSPPSANQDRSTYLLIHTPLLLLSPLFLYSRVKWSDFSSHEASVKELLHLHLHHRNPHFSGIISKCLCENMHVVKVVCCLLLICHLNEGRKIRGNRAGK